MAHSLNEIFFMARPLQIETAKASMERPTARTNKLSKLIINPLIK
jgi:hypothetical protein